MSTGYCPRCGASHECTEESGRVAIARLETTRDIEVARINATAGVKVAESEAVQAAAHAEGVVEGAEAIIDAASPDPVVIDGTPVAAEPEIAEPEIQADPEMMPPEIAVPTVTESRGKGWWDDYR